jgi:hypothetical protein
MKKLLIALALVATTLFSSSAAFASDGGPTKTPEATKPAALADDAGSADDIIGSGCNGTYFYEFHCVFGLQYAVIVGRCGWWEPDVWM